MSAGDHDETVGENKMTREKTMDIKRILLVGITLVLMATLVSCMTAEPDAPSTQSASLLDTEWKLISLNGGDLIEERAITLRFGETSLKGSGGCNTYGGSYMASEDRLSVSGVYATEMACMEPRGIMDQEQTYLQLLNTVLRYRMEDGQLELYNEAGSPILVFATDQTSAAPDDTG